MHATLSDLSFQRVGNCIPISYPKNDFQHFMHTTGCAGSLVEYGRVREGLKVYIVLYLSHVMSMHELHLQKFQQDLQIISPVSDSFQEGLCDTIQIR